MKKLRIGLVGCGKIATCNHAPGIAQLGIRQAEIVALYDIRRPKAELFAQTVKLPNAVIHTRYESLLASDIDAVILATPNDCHFPQTLAALRAGKHVLVEKPMAGSTVEADRMIKLAEQRGLVLQVNQSLRFSPLYAEIRKRVAAGTLGRPMHARCLRAAANSPDVSWSPGAVWFVQKRHQGSLVGDIAVHMADFLQGAFGPVRRIQAITRNWSHEVEDNVTALFDFANGATGVLQLSWTFPRGEGALELYGDAAALRTTPAGFEIVFRDTARPTLQVKGADLKPMPSSHRIFVQNVRRGASGAWQAGREALALCEAIVRANRQGRAVRPRNRKPTA